MAVADSIIGAESGGDPFARNSRSSAGGSGQFIDSTWLAMLQKHRPDLVQGKSREQLLRLKFDPELSRQMTDAYATDNGQYLKGKGFEPTPANTYLAHFAGPAGAAAMLANPQASAEATLGPAAAQANPFIAGKTGADMAAWAAQKMTPAQAMAKSLRQRYGNADAQGGATAAPAAPGSAGMDRLKAALGASYDPEALSTADQFLKGGDETAKGAKNWMDVLNSAAQTGLGTYEKNYGEGAKKKAYNEEIRQGLAQGTDTKAMARLLMASPDPQQQAMGLELFSKAETAARANPETFGTTPQYYEDPQTKELRFGVFSNKGTFKPMTAPGKILPPTYAVDTGTGTQVTTRAGGVPVSNVSKDLAGAERQKEVGKGQGLAQVDLPNVESNANSIFSQVDAVRTDPYLSSMTGPFDTYLPNLSGSANRVQSKVDQLGGKAFLQAFKDLKGGGQITEIEGEKATSALSRLQTMGVNDADYTKSLDDFKTEVQRLVDLARTRANGGAPAAAPNPDQPGKVKTLRFNPQTGELE